jgi:uncharacterized membrane protein
MGLLGKVIASPFLTYREMETCVLSYAADPIIFFCFLSFFNRELYNRQP